MANLVETEEYPAGIRQLEMGDPVLGGAPNEETGAGMDNIPHQQLAKRTRWLKARVDQLLGKVVSATETVAGLSKLATKAQVLAGTDEANVVTPARLADAMASFGMPLTGMIVAFGGTLAPGGWLMCNGAVVSRTAFPQLFEVLGTSFGAGDGTTTFRLPDLRGEFLRGADAGRGIDAGRGLGSAQDHALQRHNHRLRTDNGLAGSDFSIPDNIWHRGGFNSYPQSNAPPAVTYSDGTDDGGDSGGTWANETRPRNVAVNFIIKT